MPNRQLEYFDELRGETGIDILVSDQGAGALEKNLCNDFDLLLEIAHTSQKLGSFVPG